MRSDAGETRVEELDFGELGDNEVLISDSFVGTDGRENPFIRKCDKVIVLRTINKRRRCQSKLLALTEALKFLLLARLKVENRTAAKAAVLMEIMLDGGLDRVFLAV